MSDNLHPHFMAAFEHWTAVGYTYNSAWNLARAMWAKTREERAVALKYVLANTNQREEDLV
jgi:hypothetical protein